MDEEDRATIRNKLMAIDGIYKAADNHLKALTLNISGAKTISRKATVNKLWKIRILLDDIPGLKRPIRDIVDKGG